MNLYGFVGNEPTDYVDTNGLLPNLITTGPGTAKTDSSTFVFDNERAFYDGHITVTGPGIEKVHKTLHIMFSTAIGQRMLRTIQRKNLSIWIYTGDYKLHQNVFGSELNFARTFADVERSCGCPTAAININSENRLWTGTTGSSAQMPFDVILFHELGHAVFKCEDTGSGAGDNVNLVENPYRAQRREQIKAGRRGPASISAGSYAPRIKYSGKASVR